MAMDDEWDGAAGPEEPDALEADVDAAIAACGGNPRAAVRALLIAQAYYEAEVSRLAEALGRRHAGSGSGSGAGPPDAPRRRPLR